MKSPIQALMEEHGAPLTRDEYLKWTHLGKSGKVTPEEEAELPHRFAYPIVEHKELPESSPAASGEVKGEQKGAPADFAGMVLPNDDGVEPQLDTDPPKSKTAVKPDIKLDKSLATGKAKMDISNPAPDIQYKVEHNPLIPVEQ